MTLPTSRRQAYANDLDPERSLIAVTAKTNKAKADQDPAEWMPPAAVQHCAYVADRTPPPRCACSSPSTTPSARRRPRAPPAAWEPR
jgi:hypothetical protein